MKIICTDYERQILESIIRNSSPFNYDVALNGMSEALYLGGKPIQFEIENKEQYLPETVVVQQTINYRELESDTEILKYVNRSLNSNIFERLLNEKDLKLEITANGNINNYNSEGNFIIEKRALIWRG